MLCPVLVGRSEQLRLLAAVVADARDQRGTWVTVAGEAGVGKTRLVAEAVDRSGSGGTPVLMGRCSAVDRSTPYRPLAECLIAAVRARPRPDSDPAIVPYVPVVARFVPHWRHETSPVTVESPAVVGESLLRVLGWLNEGGHALLVLEDLQWADPDTLAVCDYLIDHLGSTSLAVIATVRSVGTTADVSMILRRTPHVQLGPLTDEEVLELATACLGRSPSRETMAHLHHTAGGLPLLVEDLLDDPGSSAGASRFAELVGERLETLSADAHRAAAAAALLGERCARRQLIAVVGANGGRCIDEVVRAGLLVPDGNELRFRHALTQDIVLAATAGEADQLAATVAGVLEDGDNDTDLATAAELRLRAGDPARASQLFARAAAAAQHSGAPEAALALLTRAALAATDRATRTDLDLARLRHLVDHGQAAKADAHGMRLLDTTAHDEARMRAVRILLARTAVDAGRPADAARQLDALSDPTGAGPDVLVLRARVALAVGDGDRRSAAEHLAHQAVAAAATAGRPEVACEAFDIVARCARARSLLDAELALNRGLAVAEEHDLVAWQLRLLNEVGTIEMLRAADGRRLVRAFDAAMAAGALDVAAGTAVNIAALHAMRGELDEAMAAAERARQAADRLGLRPLVAAALVMAALSDGFRGRRKEMEVRLAEAETISPDDADLHAFAWGAGRGLCALVREERADAIRAMQRAVQMAAPIDSLDTARGPLLVARAADGHATIDDLTAARATATPGAGWSDLWVGLGEAMWAGASGDASRAEQLFAAADLAGRRHPLFRAIGLRLAAEAGLRDGWGEPVRWLTEADAVFVAGGQDRIAAACRALLKQAGAPTTRRRGADRGLPPDLLRRGVTAREAEVLTLVSEHLGNKEIAARLYLSPRTVEKHVASLLAKFAVSDRAGLIEATRWPSRPGWGRSTHAPTA